MARLSPHKFLTFLLSLAFLMVGYPLLYEFAPGRLLYSVLVSVVFVAAFGVVLSEKRHRVLTLFLGLPPLAGVWTGYALPELPRVSLAVALHAFAAVFFIFMVTRVLAAVYKTPTVTADDIFGALCAYLLIGLLFGHLYCLTEALAPGSFRGYGDVAAHLQDEARSHFLLTYFSFITLTTLGYGDITPASGTARALTMLEAVTGQFYVAVLIAELVGRRAAQPVRQPPDPSQKS